MAGGKKEHVDKVRESKFNRQRCETAELRSNCGKDGYVFRNEPSPGTVNAAGQCEFHHVLPIQSLQDAKILEDKTSKTQKDFLHKCMATTNWNINKQPNLIGLPRISTGHGTRHCGNCDDSCGDSLTAPERRRWRMGNGAAFSSPYLASYWICQRVASPHLAALRGCL